MLIGYACVSTDDQDTRLQIDALKRAGCEKIYEERVGFPKSMMHPAPHFRALRHRQES
jgi:DNA invertase Pin-like site-specific DNA recombinase